MALEGDHKALILKAINAHSDPEPAAAEPLPTPSAPPGLWRPQVAEAHPSQAYQGSDFGYDLPRDVRQELIQVAKAGGNQCYQGLWKEKEWRRIDLKEAPDAFLFAAKCSLCENRSVSDIGKGNALWMFHIERGWWRPDAGPSKWKRCRCQISANK
eukprot:s726_g29.t1